MTKIACIGDYNPDVTAHQAIPKALEIAADSLGATIEYEWINTVDISSSAENQFDPFDAFWVVPASPYQNMDGALRAIRYAREKQKPLLGTCGGYQHAVLEFARNELGLEDAANAEVTPETNFPLIAPLSCALVEQDGQIKFKDGSRAKALHGSDVVCEKYHCSYGFNAAYLHLFEASKLKVTGFDLDGDPRIVELDGHPFFIGTAYQPERSALRGESHPLVTEFVRTASGL